MTSWSECLFLGMFMCTETQRQTVRKHNASSPSIRWAEAQTHTEITVPTPTQNYDTCTTLVTVLTFTFRQSSVSSSSMTRQVHGFVITSSTFICCCLLDFLLRARGMSRDKADNIAVSLT